MIDINKRQTQAKWLRIFRKIHRTTGVLLFVFFFFVAVTGLMLGWKKNSAGLIMAKSYQGTSTNLKEWLPLNELHENAIRIMRDSVADIRSLELERIDIRKDKGMAKFVFAEGYWAVQLDGATGQFLHLERRRSDFIENVHDGSILDYYMGTPGKPFKLVYTSIMGLALLLFTITGFWLWYGPKRMRGKLAKR